MEGTLEVPPKRGDCWGQLKIKFETFLDGAALSQTAAGVIKNLYLALVTLEANPQV